MNKQDDKVEDLLKDAVKEAKELGIDTKEYEEDSEDAALKKKYEDAEEALKKKYAEKRVELAEKVKKAKENPQTKVKKDLMFKAKEGDVVEGQTLIKRAELELNNKLLAVHNTILKAGVIVGGFIGIWALTICSFVVYKIVNTGAVNTYIAHCAGV